MNIQFKKGVLELCVLSLLARKDCYGYELARALESSVSSAEGSVYPLMRRLKEEGYLNTYLVESQEGPSRKYYRITDAGRTWQLELGKEWRAFSKAVSDMMEASS